MNTQTRHPHPDAPKPRYMQLPHPRRLICDMLDQFEQTPDLETQASLFSTRLKLGSSGIQWHNINALNPTPWLMCNEIGDDCRKLIIVSNITQKLLIFEAPNGMKWIRHRAADFAEADLIIPKQHANNWMSRPASDKQRRLIASIAQRPLDFIPHLSMHSASKLIDTKRFAGQAHVIRHLVDLWEFDIENYPGDPHILSPYIMRLLP